MSRLPDGVLRRVRDIEAEIETVEEGGPDAFALLAPMVRELFGAHAASAYSFVQRPGAAPRLALARFEIVGAPAHAAAAFDAFLAQAPARWTGYNPTRPEPVQRNVALPSEAILERLAMAEPRSAPVFRFLADIGLDADAELRVLVCEGASLLAWVGAFREQPFDDLERRTLQRLMPAMRRRFVAERRLASEPGSRALFLAAFAAIARPAFVTDRHGAALEANAAGERWLLRQGRAGREELRAAVRRAGRSPGVAPRWSVTRVAAPGTPERELVVLEGADQRAVAERAAHAAGRLGLTPRQAAVLALVAEGLTTRAIAAELAVAERTVETHLTAIYERAQVECRAELVTAVWRLSGD